MRKSYKESEYSKKLRDPQWQRVRLQIMGRDDFSCQSCFDDKKTLNVHHCYYEGEREPWEYPLESLITLCEECHAYETDCGKRAKSGLIEILSRNGFLTEHFLTLTYALRSADLREKDFFCQMLAWAINDEDTMKIIDDRWTNFSINQSQLRRSKNG